MAAKIQIFFLVCVSALLTSGFAYTADFKTDNVFYGERTNISSLIDDVLPGVREYILKNGMDPMKLDDIYQKLPGVFVHNKMISLTNGGLQGLSGITRGGDTILISENNIYTIDITFGFDALKATYDYLFQDFFIKRRGQINGSFNDVKIRVVADVKLADRKVHLRMVKIVKVGQMSISFGGHVIDPVINVILKHITNHFSNQILKTVEKQLVEISQNYVDKLIDKLPLSEEFMTNNNIPNAIPASIDNVSDDLSRTYSVEPEGTTSLFRFKFHVKACVST